MLFVISGPSGVGKSSLIAGLCAAVSKLEFVKSVTTRAPRGNETAYKFVTADVFQELASANAFVEHTAHFGNSYGTLRADLDAAQDSGAHLVLDMDVVGARALVLAYPKACTIFIAPPSLKALKDRLLSRGSETEASLQTRLDRAESECANAGWYAHTICNDVFDVALAKLVSVANMAIAS